MPVNQFPCKRTILYGKIYIQPVYLRLYYLNNEQLLKHDEEKILLSMYGDVTGYIFG